MTTRMMSSSLVASRSKETRFRPFPYLVILLSLRVASMSKATRFLPLSLSYFPAPICLICNLELETIEHTLLLCPWTSQIWNPQTLQVKISRAGLTRFDEWLYNVKEDPRSSPKFDLIVTALWCIWKDRNHFIFRKNPPELASYPQKWRPPNPGMIKTNIDASFVSNLSVHPASEVDQGDGVFTSSTSPASDPTRGAGFFQSNAPPAFEPTRGAVTYFGAIPASVPTRRADADPAFESNRGLSSATLVLSLP